MSLASAIRQFVEQIAISARIVSPRFSDYKIESFDFYGEPENFEEVIRQEVEKYLSGREAKKDEISVGTDEKSEGSDVEAKAKSNILRGVSMAQNPASIVSMGLKFLPHAALVALAISLIPIIFKELTRDGGLMDLRWKRIIDDEVNAFLDRQTQRNTQIGTRQVIIQSRAGFIAINGAAGNENTIRQIRDGGVDGNRLAQIDIIDHSKELFS